MILQDPITLSELICSLCEEITSEMNSPTVNIEDSVALDIASGYHSYVFDINTYWKKVSIQQSKHFVNC